MNRHTGDFVVTGNAVIRNEISGVTYVKPGANPFHAAGYRAD